MAFFSVHTGSLLFLNSPVTFNEMRFISILTFRKALVDCVSASANAVPVFDSEDEERSSVQSFVLQGIALLSLLMMLSAS